MHPNYKPLVSLLCVTLVSILFLGSSHEPAADRYDWVYTASDEGPGLLAFQAQSINEAGEDAGVRFAAQVHLKAGNEFIPADPEDYLFTVVKGSVLAGLPSGMTSCVCLSNSNGVLEVRVEDLKGAGGVVAVMIEGFPIGYGAGGSSGFADGPGDTYIEWSFSSGSLVFGLSSREIKGI